MPMGSIEQLISAVVIAHLSLWRNDKNRRACSSEDDQNIAYEAV